MSRAGKSSDHTIFDHSVYVDATMLDTLEKKYNVKPHVYYQGVGDAVFIPTGCPHQGPPPPPPPLFPHTTNTQQSRICDPVLK